MPEPAITHGTRRRRLGRGARSLIAAMACGVLLATGVSLPAAAATTPEDPPQEPGVTVRTFQTPPLTQLCTLKSGQTPNVDKLMPNINLSSDADFGAVDNFLTQVTANLTVTTPGEYTFRLTSDDGSRMSLNGAKVIDNDGLHGSQSVDGTVTLAAGVQSLFVEMFEATNGQELKLEWRTPGSSTFTLVPTSALSTEAGVVRVTAPGTKYCEGSEDTAGDGLRLETVNPNYRIVDLRPPGFEPKVSGLDFTDDGALAVLTTGSVSSSGWVPNAQPGEVFFLDGAQEADGPEDVTVRKVATGLKNPMGIAVIGDLIYVSERQQLTELSDPDGDGTYDTRRTVATWPDGGNFHEFAFGLAYDDQNFYVNLSVAINNGGNTTTPQPAADRGTALKINRTTGEVSYIAGGLRTPNGVAFGPDNELFATDNQGDWLPASKLINVKQDRFYNHFTQPAGRFDTKPVSQPAVWIPQNEIGNSPTAPMLLSEGTFAGQMLIGDLTYGGLQRAFLEKVEGEYQGAIFRYSAGFEVGVNRVIEGPDKSIYVGGTGEGGNWGEAGKLRFGLQKLVPIGDEAFDMKSMKVVEGGFQIEYTEPISTETAARIATSYRASQWRYAPTSTYGGPKVDEELLPVTSAQVSEDRRTVTLQLDGLEEGRVVYIRSPRPFASETGKELWSTEAWYTLNSLPGYVAPSERGWYEAEEATLIGGAKVDWEHSGYSGGGFAGGLWNAGSALGFTVDVEQAGSYPVNVRYANGPDPAPGTKDMNLYVNGTLVGPWQFPSTTDWKTWSTITRSVDLAAGSNNITLKYDTGNKGNLNVDVLSVGSSIDICSPTPQDAGYRGLFDGTLASLDGWRMAGPGGFGRQADCSIRGEGGMGLLWNRTAELTNYSLKLDWKLQKDDNGGVFIGFPNPMNDPWIGVNQGYEIQIDASDAADRTTGAVYTFQGANSAAIEQALNPVGAWNAYEIQVQGQNIKVYLNGTLVNDFTSQDPARDLKGYIGVQNHGSEDQVFYRNIRVKELNVPQPLAVSATSEVRCMAGKAFVSVRATNEDTVPVDIVLTSAFGERTITDVQPGSSVFQRFTTRATSVPAGTGTASATSGDRTGEASAPYAAKSCG